MVAGSSRSDGQQVARPVQVAGELLEQAECGGRVAHWSRRPTCDGCCGHRSSGTVTTGRAPIQGFAALLPSWIRAALDQSGTWGAMHR